MPQVQTSLLPFNKIAKIRAATQSSPYPQSQPGCDTGSHPPFTQDKPFNTAGEGTVCSFCVVFWPHSHQLNIDLDAHVFIALLWARAPLEIPFYLVFSVWSIGIQHKLLLDEEFLQGFTTGSENSHPSPVPGCNSPRREYFHVTDIK